MADFVAVLRKTLNGLGDATPAMRERVYEKARATIAAKLAAITPPPPASVADRQKRALEDAIATIEREYAPPDNDPLAELENVFASLKNPQAKPLSPPPPLPKVETWPKATPSSSTLRPATTIQRPAPPPPPPEAEVEAEAEAELDIDEPIGGFDRRTDATRQRSYGGIVAAAIVLAVVVGGGYGVWLNKDAFAGLFGGGTPRAPEAAAPAPVAKAPAAPPAQAPSPAASAPGEGEKFTQRLTPDGTEVNPGPAGGATGVGEGTSVAALTPGDGPDPSGATTAEIDPAAPDAPEAVAGATPAAPAPAPAAAAATSVAVGQKAIFYEERTSSSEGSAEPGSIVWSLVQESPGGDRPPEPAIRAEATIPGKDLQLRMTIRRNADQTLPASHIIEMIFLTPEGFGGGGIENILRIAMKGSEQEAGNPLIGIPAKIADGFFLVALNDSKAEIDANLTLLRRQSWIDVPIVYKSGRRALFTMEKGIPGEKVFDEALKAWQASTAG